MRQEPLQHNLDPVD